jgi:hypothetical protein
MWEGGGGGLCPLERKVKHSSCNWQLRRFFCSGVLINGAEKLSNKLNYHFILFRVHDIFRTRLPFTNAADWTCASSLSLTPTPFLPSSLPWVALRELDSTIVQVFVRETSPGNSVWLSFLNFVSAPGGVPCHRGLPTRRPRGKP